MHPRFFLASLVLLAACASGVEPAPKAGVRSVEVTAASAATESLPAQTLAPGKCGLFLWTQDEPRRFVLFYEAGAASAKAVLNGQETALAIESQGGDVFAQFMTRIDFRAPNGVPVSLALEPGDLIEGGRRVPLARMVSQDDEGWETIVPLAGLTACQPT